MVVEDRLVGDLPHGAHVLDPAVLGRELDAERWHSTSASTAVAVARPELFRAFTHLPLIDALSRPIEAEPAA
jgi:hypothetical protein